jgi:hypothetical protein
MTNPLASVCLLRSKEARMARAKLMHPQRRQHGQIQYPAPRKAGATAKK